MELNGFVVISRHEQLHRLCLVCDHPQQVTVQSTGRHRLGQRNSSYTQLTNETLIYEVSISTGINKG